MLPSKLPSNQVFYLVHESPWSPSKVLQDFVYAYTWSVPPSSVSVLTVICTSQVADRQLLTHPCVWLNLRYAHTISMYYLYFVI